MSEYAVKHIESGLLLIPKCNAKLANFLSGVFLDIRRILLTPEIKQNFLKFTSKDFIIIEPISGVWNITETLSQELVNMKVRAALLADCFSFLQVRTNDMLNQFSGLGYLTYDDLSLYPTLKPQYIERFAEAVNLSLELADKQLEFEYENLKQTCLRGKEIQWKYINLLKMVETTQDAKTWKKDLILSVKGVGKV